MRMENPWARKFDAVVLGAGNGGMSGATQLALSGKNVLMLRLRHEGRSRQCGSALQEPRCRIGMGVGSGGLLWKCAEF